MISWENRLLNMDRILQGNKENGMNNLDYKGKDDCA